MKNRVTSREVLLGAGTQTGGQRVGSIVGMGGVGTIVHQTAGEPWGLVAMAGSALLGASARRIQEHREEEGKPKSDAWGSILTLLSFLG